MKLTHVREQSCQSDSESHRQTIRQGYQGFRIWACKVGLIIPSLSLLRDNMIDRTTDEV